MKCGLGTNAVPGLQMLTERNPGLQGHGQAQKRNAALTLSIWTEAKTAPGYLCEQRQWSQTPVFMSLALKAAHLAKLLSEAHGGISKGLARYLSQDTLGTVRGKTFLGMGMS